VGFSGSPNVGISRSEDLPWGSERSPWVLLGRLLFRVVVILASGLLKITQGVTAGRALHLSHPRNYPSQYQHAPDREAKFGCVGPPNAMARPTNTPGNTCIGAHTSADRILATYK
jgi:hypothetical protein